MSMSNNYTHHCTTYTRIGDSMEFTFTELREATNNFSADCIIGEGGYGTVYRATVRKCLDVAIKVLSKVLYECIMIVYLLDRPLLQHA